MTTLPPVSVVAPPIQPTFPTKLVWRVLDHAFVEKDGVPTVMRIVLRLEVGNATVGPFELGEPGCTLGGYGDDPSVVAGLTCYYAGGGDYVEVHETSPGSYVVTTYAQAESYPDEPSQKEAKRKLGTFIAARPPLEQVIVALDGGAYSAY